MNTEIRNIFKSLEKSYEYQQKRIEKLVAENKKLRKNAKAVIEKELKEENEYLRERIGMSFGCFDSLKEKKAYEKFEEKHMHDRATSKINGGKTPYVISQGTGIGIIKKVVCPICGKEEDITDISVW